MPFLKPSLPVKWLFLLLLVLFIPHLFISYQYYQNNLMTDLHLRIIGSRLLEAGRSPYFYQWQPGDDYRLYNPNIFIPNGLDGVTVTPSLLWFQLPFAGLNYCNIKFGWWVIEELLLFGTLFFTCLYPTTLRRQLFTIFIGAVFFCYSRNWWVHVSTGQYYILFAFAFSLIAFLIKKKPSLALSLFPLTTLFRPFFALAALPFLLKDFRKNLKNFLPGVFLALAILFFSGSYKLMPEYSKAMSMYSQEIFGWQRSNFKDYRNQNIKTEDCIYPIQSTSTLGAGCLFSLQHYLKLLKIKITAPNIYLALLVAFLLSFYFITGYKTISASTENLILTSFMVYIFCELFTPANRNPYNLIQYLGIIGLLTSRASYTTIILLVLGLALNHDLPFRFTYEREIGEILMLLSIYYTLKLKENKQETHV